MPEKFQDHDLPADDYLHGLGFVEAVRHLRSTWAPEKGLTLSVRKAKDLAGAAIDRHKNDYKRIIYADPTGEGVVKRWAHLIVHPDEKQDTTLKEKAA